MDQTPNLKMPYIAAAQAQKHVTHNEAIRALDALVHINALDRDLAAPPASPAEGDRYIIAAAASGAWTGHSGHIAAWQDGAWTLLVPLEGWLAWVADEDQIVAFNGAAWVIASGGSVNPTPLVGVNASADTTNRLAVASPASLFNHAGAGHQLKINKAAATDTAALLFQNGFSGRAEIGLAGDDNLHFKVSPNGTTWTEALVADRTTGLLTVLANPATALGIATKQYVDANAGGSGGFPALTSSRTYFVRTDGTDVNDGLSNSPAGAFLTIQKAIDVASGINLGPYTITISVGAGTFNQSLTLKRFISSAGGIVIAGSSSTIITSPGVTITMNNATGWTIGGGMRLQTTAPGAYLMSIGNYSQLALGTVDFASTAYAHMYVFGKSKVTAASTYTISAGANFHAFVENAEIAWGGQTVTVTGTPAFTGYFIQAVRQSYATCFVTWSGAATGAQHLADYLSILQSLNAFPGSTAGAATNGSYKI